MLNKLLSVKSLLTVSFALAATQAVADIDPVLRNDKAVVLYQFQETTGDIIDSANPKFGAPLNLRPIFGGVIRKSGSLEIPEANVITSVAPADKITNQCKQNNAMTLEVWLENNESVEKRSGEDANRVAQPLRIVSLSKGLQTRNFSLGQFYDAGNMYFGAVNTSGNENDTTNLGNSLRDPIRSSTSAIIIPDASSERVVASNMQKVILTLGQDKVARLYLSDRNGHMYLANTTTRGFNAGGGSYFSTWRTGSYLTFGNEYMSSAVANANFALNPMFATCTTAECKKNPNRYWKGKLHLVAVYCEALTPQQIFGSGALQTITNKSISLDTPAAITPNLLKAQTIYQRITSVKTPIVDPVLVAMEKKINEGDVVGAAGLVTSEPAFYNITVRDFAARMSNRDETINVPLNDFTATIIGAVRDEVNAKKLLTDNIVYVADPAKAAVPSDEIDDLLRSNNHYEALSTGRFDLSKVLMPSTQKLFDGKAAVLNPTPAGLLTSRQWLAQHAIAGTNRRLVEYSLKQFTCNTLEEAADSSGPDDVVGRDIDRFPGGSHTKYTTTCRACHTVMDGFRPAFSNFTFANNFVKHSFVVPKLMANQDEDTSVGINTDPAYIHYKYNKNSEVFPQGRITTGTEWVNNANRGSNKPRFGWKTESGKGVTEFGALLANSDAFPQCMAKRVFRSVCKREPASSDMQMIDSAAKEFAGQRNYNLKFLFQKIVTTPECIGGG